MNRVSVLHKWWTDQTTFGIRVHLDTVIELRDVVHDIGVGNFTTIRAATQYAYDLEHGLMDQVDTSFDIRQNIMVNEQALQKLLGRGDITTNQRDVLEMMLALAQDAIKEEVWLK